MRFTPFRTMTAGVLFSAMLLSGCVGTFLTSGGSRRAAIPASRLERLRTAVLHELERERYEHAAALLDSLNDIHPDAWNCLQLGRIARLQQRWKDAVHLLNRAKRLKYHYGEACYELGRVYDEGPFRMADAYEQYHWAIKYDPDIKDAYYRAARIRMIEKGYDHGLSELEPLLERDPGYRDSYRIYTRIGSAFHKHGKLARFLRTLTRLYPDSLRFQNDMITAVYNTGDFQAALDSLASCRDGLFARSPALYYLHEARILLGLGRDEQAWRTYTLGIENIRAGYEADEFFLDLRYITAPDEYPRYFTGDLQQKKEFLRIFWKSRDPTLTTEFNERFPEHYERLRYVLKKNRRYPEQEMFDLLVDDFYKPEPWGLMSEFSKSGGVLEQSLIDDMGIIYVRHGEPDKFFTLVEEFTTANLCWHYPARPGRPDMVYYFWRPRRSDALQKRNIFRGWVLRMDPLYRSQFKNLDWMVDFNDSDVVSSIETGTATTTTGYQPARPLEISLDHFVFQADSAERIVLYYKIPEQYTGHDVPQNIALHQETVLFDGVWRELYRTGRDENQTTLSGRSSGTIIRTMSIPVFPGDYFVGFHLAEKTAGAEGDLGLQIDVPDSRRGGLGMSRIMLAEFERNRHLFRPESEHRSYAERIIPSLDRRFGRDDPIVVYFELYNILPDMEGRTSVSVSLGVTRKELYTSAISRLFSRNDDPVTVTLEHVLRGTAKNEFFLQSVTLPRYSPGAYELEIRVKDNNLGTELIRTAGFEVIH
ncbi:GWxTD domain-containing protein [bacterium]|nr:GWxTD domain-containing protein [bacterium]